MSAVTLCNPVRSSQHELVCYFFNEMITRAAHSQSQRNADKQPRPTELRQLNLSDTSLQDKPQQDHKLYEAVPYSPNEITAESGSSDPEQTKSVRNQSLEAKKNNEAGQTNK